MTAYHLKFWEKACGKTSNPFISALEIERIYVNADDRSTLGYIERRTTEGERGTDSYYDRHRRAKGDTTATVSDMITSTLSTDVLDKIVAAAIAADSRYGFLATADLTERFLSLKSFARGVNWVGPRGKDLKKLAASFTVEI